MSCSPDQAEQLDQLTMAPTTVTCEYPGCEGPRKSPEGDLDTVVKLLEMHFVSKHKPSQSSKSSAAKVEKAKRPEIAAELSDEDWNYFLSRWEAYKKATSLQGEDIVLQLMECCCEQLRRDHHRNFPSQSSTSVTETTLLAEIKQIAVRAKNRAVNRVKVNTLKQDKGEPARKFAGRIRSLATVSDYSVKCSKCQNEVPYTDEIIMDQVIAGLADPEIQRDVLSHPNAKDLTLETLLIFIEGKESGHTSLNLMAGGRLSAAAVEPKRKKCRFCGDTHILGRKHCKAAGQTCEKCGKEGHYAKVCKSGRRPTEEKNPSEDNPKVGIVAAEANWASGSSWACNVNTSPTTETFYENTNFHLYPDSFIHQKSLKEVKHEEKIGATHPGLNKRGNKKNSKKVGLPTLDTGGLKDRTISLVMILLAGSAIWPPYPQTLVMQPLPR